MQTNESITAAHCRQLLRSALPLVPAWMVGGLALCFSSTLWVPLETLDENGNLETLTRGWVVLTALVVGSLLYALAPLLGAHIMARSDFSWLPVMSSSDGLAGYGASYLRVIVLVLVYLVVFPVVLTG